MGFACSTCSLLGTRSARSFLAGPGAAHTYMVHVGAGWALAQLRRRVDRALARLDPLLGWLAVDGYGFHQGYFRWPDVGGGDNESRAGSPATRDGRSTRDWAGASGSWRGPRRRASSATIAGSRGHGTPTSGAAWGWRVPMQEVCIARRSKNWCGWRVHPSPIAQGRLSPPRRERAGNPAPTPNWRARSSAACRLKTPHACRGSDGPAADGVSRPTRSGGQRSRQLVPVATRYGSTRFPPRLRPSSPNGRGSFR